MALKTNFTDADFISSPFVDEVANPGNRVPTAEEREAVGSGRAVYSARGRAALKNESIGSKLGFLARDIKERVGKVLQAGSEAHQHGVDAKRDRKQTRDIRRRNSVRF